MRIGNSSSSSSSSSAPPLRLPPSLKRQMGISQVDRQYVHILGIATVRVVSQGFLWLLSSISKLF
jgi:hypothetical protein